MSRKNRILLRLYYTLPLLIWMIAVILSATAWGHYETTWWFVKRTLNFLEPRLPPIPLDDPIQSISLYTINGALRNLAHIVAYAVLTLLAVRALQHGQTRLKPLSMLIAFGTSLVFILLDEWVRRHTPDRHAKLSDWLLNGIGIALILLYLPIRYVLLDWERRLLNEEHLPDLPRDVSQESATL